MKNMKTYQTTLAEYETCKDLLKNLGHEEYDDNWPIWFRKLTEREYDILSEKMEFLAKELDKMELNTLLVSWNIFTNNN